MTEKRFVAIGVEWTDGFIQDHISDRDLFNIGAVCNLLNDLAEENEQLKKEDELFFGKVFGILLKYQDLFNREMADEVLEELGIELTKWFE